MRGIQVLFSMLICGAFAATHAAADLPGVIWQADHGGSVATVDFSTSGRLVASGASNGNESARVWRAADGQPVAEFPDQLSGVVWVSISPDDRYLAVGAIHPDFYQPQIRTNVYEIATQQLVRTYLGVRNAWSADGRVIATAGGAFNRDVDVDDFITGTQLASIYTGGYIGGMALAPDASFVVTGSFSDGSVSIWDVASGALIRRLYGHAAGISALALSPDGQLIASGTADPNVQAEIKLWRVADGQLLHTLEGHRTRLLGLAFSPDGRKLLSCGQEAYTGGPYNVRLWRVATGERLDTFQYDGNAFGLSAIDYAGDGSAIVLGQGSGYVTVALPPRGIVGDLNCDGVINFDDIGPFVLALSGRGAYAAAYVACDWLNADIDGDGTVAFNDINPFVALLGA